MFAITTTGEQDNVNDLKSRVRRLSTINVWNWLRAAEAEWLSIVAAVAVACLVDKAVLYALAVLFIGTRQHALALLGHEGAHGLIARRRWQNDLLANVFCFWPLFLDLGTYRNFHLAHHRHLGTGRDPELAVVPLVAPLPSGRLRIARVAAADLLSGGFAFAVKLFTALRPDRPSCLLGPIVWWAGAGTAAWLGGQFVPVVGLWVAALLTSFLAMFRLRIWTEHRGSSGTHRITASWWQRCLFLQHNTWCHDEHHRWASIPFWNLPEARRLDRVNPVRTVDDLFASYNDAGVGSGQHHP